MAFYIHALTKSLQKNVKRPNKSIRGQTKLPLIKLKLHIAYKSKCDKEKMRKKIFITSIFILLSFSIKALPKFDSIKIKDNICLISYKEIEGSSINVILYIGNDKLILIDAGASEIGKELKKEIENISNKPIKMIINTHFHQDHTGGNIELGKDAVIIGHDLIRNRLREGNLVWYSLPEYALPGITFKDSITIWDNDENIKLFAMPNSHSDTDIIVYFEKEKIACLGDIFTGDKFPSMDWLTGDIDSFPKVLDKIINKYNEDVLFIPGHGSISNKKELISYYKMITESIKKVKYEYSKCSEITTLQNNNILEEWKSYDGGYVSANEWIEFIIKGIDKRRPKISLADELYKAQKINGVDGFIERFNIYKKYEVDKYFLNEWSMYVAVKYIIHNYEYEKARKVCDMFIQEYPKYKYAYFLTVNLFMANNAVEDAKITLNRLLEMDPDDITAKTMLNKLDEEKP